MSAAISNVPEFDEILKRSGWTPPPPRQAPLRSPPKARPKDLTPQECQEHLAQFSPQELDQFKSQPLTMQVYADEMVPVWRKFIAEEIERACAPLREKIAELEARPMPGFKYVGIWRAGNLYRQGEFVTHMGSLFIAQRNATEKEMPEDGSGAFVLCAKRGRDAKLPKDVHDAVRDIQRMVKEEKNRAAPRTGDGVATER